MMNIKKRKVYIMSGTHWDREWYRPFQGFRYKLAQILSQVIETLENDPDFGVFTLDGQTIPLQDFLDVRPEMKNRLTGLIKQGRILIGPWYCMPDEFLVSGESIIKNLMLGERISRSYGVEPWKYGYICDVFGHTPQFPQILNGFGIEGALLGRGANEGDCPMHFIWEAPDGSRCITFKLPDHMLYGDFLCRAIMRYNECKTEEEKDEIIKTELERQFARTDIPIIMLMDALDHMPIHGELNDICRRIERLFPGTEAVVGNAADMAEELLTYVGMMPTLKGQLTEPARDYQPAQRTITDTCSSRYDIKKDNDICQTLTEKWIAPFTVFASFHGVEIYRTYLNIANEFLLKNHSHDSICGCSIDAAHQDMKARFNQVKAIEAEMTLDINHCLFAGLSADSASNDILIQLFNPMPYEIKRVVKVAIPFPADYSSFYAEEPFFFEKINKFFIKDDNGNTVPYSIVHIEREGFIHDYGDKTFEGDMYTVAFMATLPPIGVCYYTAAEAEKHVPAVRYLDSLMTSFTTADNGILALTVNNDGTFDLLDKETGRRYESLLWYVDDGELGDGWNHVRPANDKIIVSKCAVSTVEVLHDGPALCTFGVKTVLRIPAKMDYRQKRAFGYNRDGICATVEINSKISLALGSRHVEVETDILNDCEEHRLRAVFPTGIKGGQFSTSQMFAEVRQNSGRDRKADFWNQPGFLERPMQGIVCKYNDDGEGLGIVSAYGLHECSDLYDGTLTVTMLRSFSKTIRTSGETDGKLKTNLSYHYAVVPMNQKTGFIDLQRLQDEMAAGVRAGFFHKSGGVMPSPRRLLRIEGQICYSILKFCDNAEGILLRLYNPCDTPAKGRVVCDFTVENAATSGLDETVCEYVPVDGNAFDVELAPYKIQSYVLNIKKQETRKIKEATQNEIL